MPTELFEPRSEEAFRKIVLNAKQDQHSAIRVEYDTAIDYWENRQISDVEKELNNRFPSSQMGDAGQEIQPLALPLTERYVDEAACIYNRSVRRYFVDADGQESGATKEQSAKLERALEKISYDEIMHLNEKVTRLLKTSCVWYQLHNGKVRPVIVYPQKVYPVAPPVELVGQYDPSDANDYAGFIVETEYAAEDIFRADGCVYAFVSPQETIVYSGSDPSRPDKILTVIPNETKWDQGGSIGVVPGQMLTFWHNTLISGALVKASDCDVMRVNREINVHWSVLFDTIRFQADATPVIKLADPGNPRAKVLHGARFPVVLNIAEDFSYAGASANYTQTSQILLNFAKYFASLKRQNPEDFSTEGSKAVSGFSKLVSSLPKIEAREEYARRAASMETTIAGPRITALLIQTGELDPIAANLTMRAQFANVSFPTTPEEDAVRLDTEISYGLTTAAKELAKRKKITLEEATSEVEQNLTESKRVGSQRAQPTQPQQPQQSDILSRLINKGKKA